jgi:hypothetical protein
VDPAKPGPGEPVARERMDRSTKINLIAFGLVFGIMALLILIGGVVQATK